MCICACATSRRASASTPAPSSRSGSGSPPRARAGSRPTRSSSAATVSATAGVHIAFQADDRETVERFHAAALAAGGRDNGPPGERDYHPGYFARLRLERTGRTSKPCTTGLSSARPLRRLHLGEHVIRLLVGCSSRFGVACVRPPRRGRWCCDGRSLGPRLALMRSRSSPLFDRRRSRRHAAAPRRSVLRCIAFLESGRSSGIALIATFGIASSSSLPPAPHRRRCRPRHGRRRRGVARDR